MEKHYRENLDDHRTTIRELTSSNNSQSYNEVLMHKELIEARAKIDKLMTNDQNTSIQSQQARANEIEEPTTNNPEELSLLWDNSADLGQQKEISNSLISQQDPLITNEKEDTKIYENQTQIANDNNTNEFIENINKVKAANLAELNMTLRSKEKLKELTYLKDYVKE